MANDLDQSVSNAIAGGVSAPVDLIAWALRKAGVPGLEKPVMGSDWMREKGLTAPVKSQGAAIVGETLGNLADPAAAIGKGVAATKAMLLGVNASDPAVQKMLQMLRRGATRTEAWQTTGREIVPRHPGTVPTDLDDPLATYVREISDVGLRAKPNMLLSPLEKEEMIQKLEPIRQAGARLRAKDADMFIQHKGRLSDFVEHPELFAARPDMQHIPMSVLHELDAHGSQSPSSGKITIGGNTFLTAPSSGSLSTTMHELMHNEQGLQGMPLGANPKNYEFDPVLRDKLYELNQRTYSAPSKYAWDVYNTSRHRTSPYNLYKNILGEQQARAVQNRLRMSDADRALLPPSESYDNLESGVDAASVQDIIKMLRKQITP